MKASQLQGNNSSTVIIKDTQTYDYQKQADAEPVPFCSLFRFANRTDYIIMAVGTFFSICNGAAMPLFALLWGDMLDSFKSRTQMVDQTKNMLLMFVYIGLAVFASGWMMIACWLITGQRQSIQCRKQYLRSLLRQQIGWFDCINQSQLSSQFSADTMAFQGAISDKIPLIIYIIAMAISGMVVAFARGWLLTLVLLGVFPVIIGSMYLYMYNVQNKGKREQKSYAIAGGRAQQALASIKTVKMLNGQAFQSRLYDQCLVGAGEGTVKYGIFSGISIGGAFFAMLTAYSLGFWFGAHCINDTERCPAWMARQEYTAGIVFTVFFSVIIVGFNMSQLPPSLKKITEGRAAAGRIFKIIDREPRVRNPVNGIKIPDFKGVIRFHDVTFSYPKQKSKKILDRLSLQINKNKVAFVGESGCGKSTILQLIMRFYDPDSGYITVDGHDLRNIDLVWLREVIGYVGQEPVLFDTTIRENLLFANEKATQEQLENALKKAEAWEFVNKLQKKMDTNVGLGGGQISGGQKQRLAIARAILRDPKILLLDQATSALDRKNQKLIQRTLNKISQARTSITIAHRVKTIMNSDQIFVIEKGRVLEQGKFEQLKRFNGIKLQEDNQDNQKMVQQKKQNVVEKVQNVGANKLSKEELLKKEKEELIQVYNKSTYRRVFSYAAGSQILFVLGILASGILGAVYPVFSIFLSSMLQIMLTKKNFIDEASTRALIFFLLGVLGLLMSIVQNAIFSVVGQKITRQIRSQTFYKLMKLPIYWYQKPKNSVGTLTARLAVDCKQVKQMTTTYIYGLVQNLSTLLTGLVIAFIFQWRTSLVALGLIPFLIAAGAIRMAFRTGSATKSQQSYKSSTNIIMQSMTNIRTVCSFGYENVIFNKYSKMMEEPYNLAVKNGFVSGFFYGVAQLIMFVVIALIFYIGSLFVQNDGVSIENMFTAIFAIFFSAMTVGNNSHILPDMAECKVSAANLFLIMDTKDEDQIQIQQKSKLLKTKIDGNIELKDIKFKYETRSEYLFNNFNLQIPFREKVAFVGTSGCGKSTIMSFLLRFYQPESGNIELGGVNIKDFDIHWLRAQFGVVSQEPVLFNTSFKENIKYNMDKATDQQIVMAAKQAHAYDFIMNQNQKVLVNNFVNSKDKAKQQKQAKQPPKTGFDRSVGIKGSHISGGQKQRVAIARAILRKPQILLLDEATSALDSQNEKKVQQCLDQIMQNKSSISIAHRLDTIKNSKLIYVFDKGRVAEQGNYQQLMAEKGYFYNLEKGIEFQ